VLVIVRGAPGPIKSSSSQFVSFLREMEVSKKVGWDSLAMRKI